MKERNNKSHHYIPQCYLKNFTLDEKSLWVYNKQKKENKTYQQAVSNICCKDDFYSLEHLPNDKLFIEKEFFSKNVEPLFSEILKRIINKGIKYHEDKIAEVILTPEEKYQFAYLLTIQWFRTPLQRQSISQLSQDATSKIIPLFKEGMALETGNENYKKLDIQVNINPIVEQAIVGYMNPELLDLYANALTNNYWEFFISSTNNVYTSDFPITVKMHEPEAQPMCEGLACLGSELTYPISKNICLTIWDRDYFKNKKMKDSYFTSMTQSDLNHFNTYRYAYANEVYCCDKKFDLLLQMYAMKGEELYATWRNK